MRMKIIALILFLISTVFYAPLTGASGSQANSVDINKIFSVADNPKQSVPFSLMFPLENTDAYHAKAAAVFDHSMKNRWFKPDAQVIDFRGEIGDVEASSCFGIDGVNELCSYSRRDGKEFLDADLYGKGTVISFDGCAGWIYPGEASENVLAAAEGYVAYAGYLDEEAKGDFYGCYVIIDHQNSYSTIYAHLSKTNVKTGDFVSRGNKIGETGTSGIGGIVETPNLYFEVRRYNIPVDPYGWSGVGSDPYLVAETKLWEGDVEMTCQQNISKGHFKGEYWNGKTPVGDALMTKDDGVYIDKTWGVLGPCRECGIDAHSFYVKWSKEMWFEGGIYVFELSSTNGFNLYIDGTLVKGDLEKPKKQNIKFEFMLTSNTHILNIEARQAAGTSFKFSYYPQEDVPQLTLTYPNGYQILRGGVKQTVAWNSIGLDENAKIDVCYLYNGLYYPIATDLPATTKTCDWKVPNIDTTACTVLVTSSVDGSVEASDSSDGSFVVYSDNKIKPAVSITKPIDGESFKAGDLASIEWKCENLSTTSTLCIYYYFQGKWILIGYNISPVKAGMKWKIPNTPTIGAYLLIQSVNSSTIEASYVTDKPIAITK